MSQAAAQAIFAIWSIFGVLSVVECLISDARPPPDQRKFVSPVIDGFLQNVIPKFLDEDLATLFSNTFPNTLDTTVLFFDESVPDSFVITGDIEAMWLRDSTNQVLHYLPFVNQDSRLKQMICGLVNRQFFYLLHDPYANAFNFNASGEGWQSDIRKPRMTKLVHEGKYELDSIVNVLKLANDYYGATKDLNCFLFSSRFYQAIDITFATIKHQQQPTPFTNNEAFYTFIRNTQIATDTQALGGKGFFPAAADSGLVKSNFRPSDDATLLPFLIPSNAFAVVELRKLSKMLNDVLLNYSNLPAAFLAWSKPTIDNAIELANLIDKAIQTHAILIDSDLLRRKVALFNRPSNALTTTDFQKMVESSSYLAYEVDGFGSAVFMDDANIPSLLSLPYLGYIPSNNSLYQQTRGRLLSSRNPFYFASSKTQLKGIGGPHVGLGYIWPMSIIMQALTSQDDQEILICLDHLKQVAVATRTNLMTESVWFDDPSQFTRSWFAWANSLFGELIYKLIQERPNLILRQSE